MGRYYVAGIPFDSENSLKHYGVKGMEWNKHKFGLDADTRYIKWLKDAGQNIGKFATNITKNVGSAATKAANTVGTAVNKGANFVTGNQYRQNADAKRNEARAYNQKAANPVRSMGYAGDTKTARPSQWFDKDAGLSGRDYSQQIADQQRVYASKAAKANQQANEYERRANNAVLPTVNRVANQATKAAGQQARNVGSAIGTATGNASNWANQQAQNARDAIGTAAGNVGNAASGAAKNIGDFFSNRDEYQRLDDLFKHYNRNTGKWDSEENRKAFYEAQDAYNRHPLTAIPDMARQIGSNISNSPVGDFARDVGEMANQVGSNVKNFVDYNVTGEGQRRMADMLMQDPDQVNKIFENDGSGWKQSSQFTNREAADRALAEANNTPFGRVSNAAQNVGNAVSGAANKAAEGAKGFLNSAGQWVSGAANNVKSTASKAASDAGKGASGFLNSAGQWVSNATGNVKKAAENVGNNVGQAAEQARGGIGGFFDRVGDAARGAAQNAGDWVGDRARDVGSAVSGAAQNVGNNVGQAAEQARGGIGGFFDRVGDTVRGAAQNVGGAVSGAANSVSDWARNAYDNVGGAVSGAAQNAGGFFDRVGDWGRDAAQNVTGAVQNAGDWIGDRAQDVSGAVSGAAQNVYNFVDQNITGNSARADAQRYLDYARKTDDRAGDWELDANGNRTFPNDGSLNANTQYWANKSAEAQQNADNSLFGRVANAAEYLTGNNARNTVRDAQNNWNANVGSRLDDAHRYVNESKEFRENYPWKKGRNFYDEQAARYRRLADQADQVYGPVLDKAKAAYEQTLPGTIGNAAGNVADWARNAAGNVGNAVSDAYGNVADWARQAARNTGENFSNGVENLGNWAGQAAQNVGQFINDVRNAETNAKVQSALQRVSDDYAQRLQNLPPEDFRSPQHEAWVREQIRNDPQLRAYYEQYLRHSAIDDKPAGVSDAFWEKFTAEGGTREDYERDWR